MIGQTVAHYQILEKLGEGGMGVVYRARDTRLGRHVALKVLSLDAVSNPERRVRFQQEARAASALSHPNIITIYEIAIHEDQQFISMEFVQGKTLHEIIREGVPSLKDGIGYGIQMADALAAAHGAGIIHRDLKPANIMVTPTGLIKVLDFGLAKLSLLEQDKGANSDADHTQTFFVESPKTQAGAMVGTVAYMSPEQAEAKPVDPRSDVFSLGAVLYELVTGKRAFEAETAIGVLLAMMRDEPPRPRDVAKHVPPELEAVIMRCLRKDPAQRFQTMQSVRLALEGVRALISSRMPSITQSVDEGAREMAAAVASISGSHPIPERSIAVLPFANMSQDAENGMFCDGLTEDIIGLLNRVPGLHVSSRTSSFAYNGKSVDARDIGNRLRVKKLLEGSVRRAGGKVRVSAHLINTDDGYPLWSERFDRDWTDLLSLQDELSKTIVLALARHIAGGQAAAAPASPAAASITAIAPSVVHTPAAAAAAPDSSPAATLNEQGQQLLARLTNESLAGAKQKFEQAIRQDPSYAAPWAGIARYYALSMYLGAPPSEAVPKAKWAARKAFELNAKETGALVTLAVIALVYEGKFEDAKRFFSLAGDPAIEAYFLSQAKGQPAEAVPALKARVEAVPHSQILRFYLASALYRAGEFEAAIQQAQAAVSRDAKFALGHFAGGMAHYVHGNYHQALISFEAAVAAEPAWVMGHAAAGAAQAAVGNKQAALAVWAKLRAGAYKHVNPIAYALLATALGEVDTALQWLQRGVNDHDLWAAFLHIDPFFAVLSTDPRFPHSRTQPA
ncbi:MAG: protein kinase [Bryobacteraceae bacterium]|nr:protein kinase [Bryobacteraceae bacterium]